MKLDQTQTKRLVLHWYFAVKVSMRNSKPLTVPHCTIFNLKPSEIARGDKTKNQEQSVPCLSTDLEIWWPWTFEDDADFDALFCFMQTSKFECVIAWIFSSRQGRTAPSKKELVTIERGDINQRVPFFMPLSLEWGHFLLLSYLQFQLNTISFTAVILLCKQLGHYADCCTVMDSEASL